MSKMSLKHLSEEVERLQQQLAALTSQLAAAQTTAPVAAQPPAEKETAAPVAVAEPEEELSDEILLALSAAVAAYLGKRAPIRTVRLLGSTVWAQQGRVSIQASHRLNVPHHRVR